MAAGSAPTALIAAGAVVLRKRGNDTEVLLVHRPKYDDWAFPKGKQDPGEHVTVTAVREVAEETGLTVRLGVPLLPQVYAVSGGREKKVHYWVGHVVGGDDVSGWKPTPEIDQVVWVKAKLAARMLTYLDDREQLAEALGLPRRSRTLVVIRHGRAMGRKTWTKADSLRPLTRVGKLQAQAVIGLLSAYGVQRVISSTSTRCMQTVQPFATHIDHAVEGWATLSEEDATNDGITQAAGQLLKTKTPVVVCSHRPVLPQLLRELGADEEPLAPSELVVIHHRKGTVLKAERHLVR